MSVLFLSFSKALYCSSISSAENYLIVVLLLIVLFSVKLILLNPESDLNLIVSGFDNLVCIIIGIAIASWTYIDFSYIVFLTLYFPLISLPARSWKSYNPIFYLYTLSSRICNTEIPALFHILALLETILYIVKKKF